MSLEDATTIFNFLIVAPIAWVAQKVVTASTGLARVKTTQDLLSQSISKELSEIKTKQAQIDNKLDETNEKLSELIGNYKNHITFKDNNV